MTGLALPVLINREGGTAQRAGDGLSDALSRAFAGTASDIRILSAGAMQRAIADAAGRHGRIVVAGGDGTIAAAAQILAGSKTELALLPLGTLNHFARDLGMPSDLAGAAKLAVQGQAQPVDLGEVNGRRFINNASIGLYPLMVERRDHLRKLHHWPKWLAMLPASWAALSGLRHQRLCIAAGQGETTIRTPLLFVGNNRYSLESGSVGCRDSLQDGKLSVYAVARAGRAALFWFGVRAFFGKADREHDFEALGDVDSITVTSSRRSLRIALDGEVRRMALPLAFRIRRGDLNVVMP